MLRSVKIHLERQSPTGSSGAPLLVVGHSSRPDSTHETDPSLYSDDAETRKYDLSHWTEDLTFKLFVEHSEKRYRRVDLAHENPLPFIPLTHERLPYFRLHLDMANNITSHTTQLKFLQLAVALLSNNRTDGSIEHVLVGLCSNPRNLALITRFLNRNLLSTRSLADQLLLPAVEHKHDALINILLKAGANPLALRWREDIELSRVSLAAHLSLTSQIGGRLWRRNTEDSALSLAVQVGEERIVRRLLYNNIKLPADDIRRSRIHSETSRLGLRLALLKAVDRNNIPLLHLFFQPSPIKEELNDVLQDALPTVLEHAVSMRYSKMLSFLLSCSEIAVSKNQKAIDLALSSAAHGGQLQIAQGLIDRGANVNSGAKLRDAVNDETPLGLAIHQGHSDMVQLLLERGADPNLSSKGSAAPIHAAAATNNIDIAHLLLEAGADPNVPAVPNGYDYAGNSSAVKWAIIHGSVELFFLLVRYGAEISQVMSRDDDHTPLTLALMNGEPEIIQFLLDKDIWPTTDQRDHSFQACVLLHDLPLIKKFVDHGVETNDPGALCAAVYKKDSQLVEYLLAEVTRDYTHLPAGYGTAGLALAAHLQDPDLIMLFLDNGVKPFDPVLRTVGRVSKFSSNSWHGGYGYLRADTTAFPEVVGPWMGALRMDFPEPLREVQIQCLHLLLDGCGDQSQSTADREQFQNAINHALYEAAHWEDLAIAQLLVQAGADCYAKITGILETSALETAAGLPNPAFIEFFLPGGPSTISHTHQRLCAINMSLLKAVGVKNAHVVRLLLGQGADVNFFEPSGSRNRTALELAIEEKDTEIIRLLLEAGADVNEPNRIMYRNTTLQDAVLATNTEVVKLLLDAGADSYNASIALQEAVRQNDTKMVMLLLDHGANINARAGTSGATAVQHAAMNGNFEILRILLEAGGDVNAPRGNMCGRTALEGAAEQGLLDMVRYLLEIGVDVRGRENKTYRRSVYRAWSEGNAVIAEMIQDFKRARYGIADCVSLEEIIDTMDPVELEIEPCNEEPDYREEPNDE